MKEFTQFVIVDDHQLFRKGLKIVLEDNPAYKVAAEADNGLEFLKILKNTKPDVVFMDVRMPLMGGKETVEKALEKAHELKIIAISGENDIDSIQDMIFAGVEAYISKNSDYDEIHEAVKRVLSGKNYFSEIIHKQLEQHSSEHNQRNQSTKNINLSDREIEVLNLICSGCSVPEIAAKMFISERTVEKHKASMLRKTNSPNAVNLVLFALKNHIVCFS